MSREDKEWTFVDDDDDGYLLMQSNTAHYLTKRSVLSDGCKSTYSAENNDSAESSESDVDFEVVSQKHNINGKANEEVEFIKIKEDHFASLRPPSLDSQDDGSDIEVVKDSPKFQGLKPSGKTHTEETYEVVSQRPESLAPNSNSVPCVQEARETEAESIEPITFIGAESGYLSVNKPPSVEMCESDTGTLTQSWVDTTQDDMSISDKEDSLFIAELFERASLANEQDETFNGCNEQIMPVQSQNSKTMTFIFIVCVGLIFGLLLGRSLAPCSHDDAKVPFDDKPEKTKHASSSAGPVTKAKFEDISKELSFSKHPGLWRAGVQTMRCGNIFTAYLQLQKSNSELKTELQALKNEYRLFRLIKILKRSGKRSKEHEDRGIKANTKSTPNGPVPPKLLSKPLLHLLTVPIKNGTEDQTLNGTAKQEDVWKLRREAHRYKQNADLWRHRYLNMKMEKANHCTMNFGQKTHSVTLKSCMQKLSQYLNFTDMFRPRFEGGVHQNADLYLKRLQKSVSCGLNNVSKHFGNIWQTLKDKWCTSNMYPGTKSGQQKKPAGSQHARPTKTPVENKPVPPSSKWAQFRRILRMSNVIGTLRGSVERKIRHFDWRGEEPKTTSKVKEREEGGCCLKKGALSDCLKQFKKRWTSEERRPNSFPKSIKEEKEADMTELSDRGNTVNNGEAALSIPDNFEISYPLPTYLEPQATPKKNDINKEESIDFTNSDMLLKPCPQMQEGKVGHQTKPISSNKSNEIPEVASLNEDSENVLVNAEAKNFAKKLQKEIEKEVNSKFEYLKQEFAKQHGRGPSSKDHRVEVNEVAGYGLSLFRLKIENIENLIRRFSNRNRQKRHKFQEQIRTLKEETEREKKKLENDRIRFNSWALQERLTIAQEIIKNSRLFQANLKTFIVWKKSLKKKFKRRQKEIKGWLKNKLKKLLAEVETMKREAKHDLDKKDYKWRKEQKRKFKKILKNEKEKIRRVHKYYKFSLKKAMKRLAKEKRIYDHAKKKAEKLLKTYESLLNELKKQQKVKFDIKKTEKEINTDLSEIFPSVFCLGQDACSSAEMVTPSFSETPVVYCPNKDSCSDDVSGDSGEILAKDNRKGHGNKNVINGEDRRPKRSFRNISQKQRFSPLSKEALIKIRTNGGFQEKVYAERSKVQAKFDNKAKEERRKNWIKKKDVGDGHLTVGQLFGMGQSDFYKGKSSNNDLQMISWKGPLQYYPKNILLHRANMWSLSTKDNRETSLKMSVGQSQVQSPPPVLYKNGLPRQPTVANNSKEAESLVEEKKSKKDVVNQAETMPKYALPLSWYLHYSKGREKLRLLQFGHNAYDDDWYFRMAQSRKNARHLGDLTGDNWYLSMMRERANARDKLLNNDWYFNLMQHRLVKRQENKDHDSCYLKPNDKRRKEKRNCF